MKLAQSSQELRLGDVGPLRAYRFLLGQSQAKKADDLIKAVEAKIQDAPLPASSSTDGGVAVLSASGGGKKDDTIALRKALSIFS